MKNNSIPVASFQLDKFSCNETLFRIKLSGENGWFDSAQLPLEKCCPPENMCPAS
jgi:hypothetical protein